MHKNHRGKRVRNVYLRLKELKKSVDLGEEEEWDKSDGTWIWKEYQGIQQTVLLNFSPFYPLKRSPLSHHFCAALLGHISLLVRTPFLGTMNPTDSLEATVPVLPSTSPLSPTQPTPLPWRCRQHVPLEVKYLSTKIHCMISHTHNFQNLKSQN